MLQPGTSTPATPGHEHWTEVGGQPLFLWEKPATTDVRGTILFVHGSSMASTPTFDLQVPGVPEASVMDWFAAQGFNTWCFDCRGYGRSYKEPDVLATIAEGAEDAAAASEVIMARGSGPLHVYGISSGALRAALFAQNHPERVARLALDAMVWTGEGSPTLEQRRKKLEQWRGTTRRPVDRIPARSTSASSIRSSIRCWRSTIRYRTVPTSTCAPIFRRAIRNRSCARP
jgi:pimeloyl-ACP methyl ester carboxylesterase